jgi:hypothetical protein
MLSFFVFLAYVACLLPVIVSARRASAGAIQRAACERADRVLVGLRAYTGSV